MIVDASVLLNAFLPDELHPNAMKLVREYVSGRVSLKAPSLLPYELNNAVLQAERRGRINRDQADRVIEAFARLDIELFPMEWGRWRASLGAAPTMPLTLRWQSGWTNNL